MVKATKMISYLQSSECSYNMRHYTVLSSKGSSLVNQTLWSQYAYRSEIISAAPKESGRLPTGIYTFCSEELTDFVDF